MSVTNEEAGPEDTASAYIRLKVELRHDPRNQNASIGEIEDHLQQMLNHPNNRVVNVRIAVGRGASGLFIDLIAKRWHQKNIERIVRRVPRDLEWSHYADNVRGTEWFAEAVPGEEVLDTDA